MSKRKYKKHLNKRPIGILHIKSDSLTQEQLESFRHSWMENVLNNNTPTAIFTLLIVKQLLFQ